MKATDTVTTQHARGVDDGFDLGLACCVDVLDRAKTLRQARRLVRRMLEERLQKAELRK